MRVAGLSCRKCRSGRLVFKCVVGMFMVEKCDRCGSVFVRVLGGDHGCGGLV